MRLAKSMAKSDQNWPKFERCFCDVANAFATSHMGLQYHKCILDIINKLKKVIDIIFAMVLQRHEC